MIEFTVVNHAGHAKRRRPWPVARAATRAHDIRRGRRHSQRHAARPKRSSPSGVARADSRARTSRSQSSSRSARRASSKPDARRGWAAAAVTQPAARSNASNRQSVEGRKKLNAYSPNAFSANLAHLGERYECTLFAASRPSLIAHTTSDCSAERRGGRGVERGKGKG